MRSQKFLVLIMLAMVLGLAFAPVIATAQALYGCDRNARLFVVDLATGAGTQVGELPTFPDPGATEIEYETGGVRAYVQTRNGVFSAQAVDIFHCSALEELVANGASFNGLEFVNGVLYGTSIPFSCQPSELRVLDPESGTSTLVGATGFGPISGLAWDESTQTMYGITGCSQQGYSNLVTIDLSTGVATLVGSTGMTAGSLEFGPDGNLYAGGDNSDGGNLYQVNPADGSATLVGPTGFSSVTGLTYVDISLIPAEMAIKPGSCPNSFSIKLFEFGHGRYYRRGRLPVALIGSPTVDVTQIDLSTVTLEGVAPVHTSLEDVAGAIDNGQDNDDDNHGRRHHHHHHGGNGDCDCDWHHGDGTKDLVAHFKNVELAAVIDRGFVGDVRVLTMKGRFLNGNLFEATDCIVFVGRDGHHTAEGLPGLEAPVLFESIPNPFNPSTRIAYELPQAAFVTLSIYDVNGRLVERLVSGEMPSGLHVAEWNADNYASGIYFSRLRAAGTVQTRKMVLLK